MYEIRDQKDYENTKKLIEEFKTDISTLENLPLNSTHPLLRKAQIESRQSQVEDFKEQIETYERKKD